MEHLRYKLVYQMNVYVLKPEQTYQSLYEREIVVNTPLYHSEIYCGNSQSEWIPPKVTFPLTEESEFSQEYLQPIGDYIQCWTPVAGVYSPRAYKVFLPVIGQFGDFLPIEGVNEHFFLFRVHRIIDALDQTQSQIKWFKQLKKDAHKSPKIERIDKHVFQENKIQDEYIFRIPQFSLAIDFFVTERFRNIVLEHELTGFVFKQVFPHISKEVQYQKYLEKSKNRKAKRDKQ